MLYFGCRCTVHKFEYFQVFPCHETGNFHVKLLKCYFMTFFRSRAGDEYNSYSEFSVTQHDVLRDLALYMSNCECANQRQRLIMAKKEKEGGLPKEWERGMDLPFDARIVSIHIGTCSIFLHVLFLEL